MTPFKKIIGVTAFIALSALTTYAATVGDQKPAGKYGTIQCPSDGGTALVPLLSNQNAVALRNFLGDGGTAQTIYVGFDTSVTAANGFPIKDQEMLGLDVVAIVQNAGPTTLTSAIDGGATTTAGSLKPTLRCTAGTTGGAQDLRYIEVK